MPRVNRVKHTPSIASRHLILRRRDVASQCLEFVRVCGSRSPWTSSITRVYRPLVTGHLPRGQCPAMTSGHAVLFSLPRTPLDPDHSHTRVSYRRFSVTLFPTEAVRFIRDGEPGRVFLHPIPHSCCHLYALLDLILATRTSAKIGWIPGSVCLCSVVVEEIDGVI